MLNAFFTACFSSDGNTDAGNLNALMRVLCQYIVTVSVTSYQRRGQKSILTFTKIPFHTHNIDGSSKTKYISAFRFTVGRITNSIFMDDANLVSQVASEATTCHCNKSIAEAECVFYAHLTRIITYHQLG